MSGEKNIGRDAHGTARKNLSLWHREMALLEELAFLEAKGMAKSVIAKGADAELWRHEANELLGEESTAPSPAVHSARLHERIALCRTLAESTEKAPNDTPENVLQATSGSPRIAMLNSPIFGDALAVFAPIFPSAEPLFCRSFADVFEEVSNGRASFGILPLEDSAEGKLFRIYEQIERFELHIACTTDIRGDDGKTVRAALLYKNEPPHIPQRGERVLECLLFGDEGALADLLAVATAFGLALRRVDSIPLSYREDRFVQHLVFSEKNEGANGLQWYLALFMPRTTVTADYINIKAKELS